LVEPRVNRKSSEMQIRDIRNDGVGSSNLSCGTSWFKTGDNGAQAPPIG
jgi:hypothetical protein